MKPFFQDCVITLEELAGEIEKALNGLPQEALDWKAGGQINSLAILTVHTAGSQRFWMGDVIAREPSGRIRQTEFESSNLDVEDLRLRLRGALAYCRQVLARLSYEELEDTRIVPPDARSVTVGWALAHIIAHTAEHVGHMQLTRQLWEGEHR